MRELTKRQKEVLHFIEARFYKVNLAPTFREIGQRFNISVKAAYDHVKALEKKKMICCQSRQARGILPLRIKHHLKKIPLITHISPGDLMYKNAIAYLPVFFENEGREDCFGVYVCSEDMKGLGIFGGDIVIIDPKGVSVNGDVVAVVVDNDIILRKYVHVPGNRYLTTERLDRGDEHMDVRKDALLGRVIRLMRNYPA